MRINRDNLKQLVQDITDYLENTDLTRYISETECNCDRCLGERSGMAGDGSENPTSTIRKLKDFYAATAQRPLYPSLVMYISGGDRYTQDIVRMAGKFHRNFVAPDVVHGDMSVLSWKLMVHVLKLNLSRMSRIPISKRQVCCDCGVLVNNTLVPKRSVHGVQKTLCKVCAQRYSTCGDCGTLALERTMNTMRTSDGPLVVCNDCEGNYGYCNYCDNAYRRDQLHEVRRGVLTGGVFNPDPDEFPSSSGICTACKDNLFGTCESCGENGLMNSNNPAVCNTCVEYDQSVHGYSWKPAPVFYFNEAKEGTNGSLFFGVELEFERTCYSPRRSIMGEGIKSIFPHRFVYVKRDSSLDDGLEIVTHPFTFQYFLDTADTWKRVYDYLDVSPHPIGRFMRTCGMHVHLPKKAFTTGHLYKFCQWMYNPLHRGFMEKLSERKGISGYANFYSTDSDRMPKLAKEKRNPSGERYSVVNLQPRTTLEVRIFQAPFTVKSFYKNIEFLDSLYHFTSITGIKNCTMANWGEFVLKSGKPYKNLVSFLTAKELAGLS